MGSGAAARGTGSARRTDTPVLRCNGRQEDAVYVYVYSVRVRVRLRVRLRVRARVHV